MELTLANYETVLPKELLQLAKRNTVRECDETEKGRFVAYVDEGNESFDVSLTVSNNKVAEHNCECKSGAGSGFCRHKAALLLHIAGRKKTKSAAVKAKKKSKAEALLEEAEPGDLKEWVRELLQKNKDFELSFVHYFSSRQQQYTPEEVVQLTNDAIKATAGKKKNLDTTQLKKLVDLWTTIHAPIVRSYQANAADRNSFLVFHTMLETCYAFHLKINTASIKIPKYIEDVLQQTVETLNNIQTEEAWTAATGYFIDHLRNNNNYHIRIHYMLHLKNIIGISSSERKKQLTERLADQYRKSDLDQIFNAAAYTNILFGIIEENGSFSRYFDLFQPIRFDNEFNGKLIRFLIESNHLDMAEHYCHKQIQGNYRSEYNLPYLKMLNEICTISKDDDKRAEVLMNLVPHTFDFDDFLFVYNRMPEGDEKKKWRSSVLSKSQNVSGDAKANAKEFIFKLLDHEQNYKKMISSINSYTPYSFILRYFEPMARTDKALLLKTVVDKDDGSGWGYSYDEAVKDKECFPELLEAFLKHFTKSYITNVIGDKEKQRYYYTHNQFIAYMKKHLDNAV